MKKFLNTVLGVFALSVLLVGLPQTKAVAAPQVSVSFQMFYDDLAPYGQWIDDPEYGYVWVPELGGDFRPYYTGGHWVMTEYGNTWVSDYDWGWAPFHYGRWTYDNYYGWVWIPGDEWGPAWVSWRSGGGYYGWAPLGPQMGINISIGNYNMPYDWWTFIPCQYIYSPNYYSYWRGPGYNNTYINQTTIINNYYNNRYAYGPRRNDIEHYTHGRVTVYDIRNDQGPRGTRINRNTVNIYRPQVVRAGNRGSIAPRNAVRAERPLNTPNRGNVRSQSADRGFNRNSSRVERPAANQQQNMNQRPFERADNDRRVEQQRPQVQRQGAITRQRQEMEERQNAQRMQQERGQRENDLRMQQAREQQAQRQQQMQRQQRMQVERQQVERQQMQVERQQQMQRQQVERQQQMQRQQVERQQQAERQQQMQQRQQMERPQREWRRPEPQMQQRQGNRVERQPAQRTSPERGRPFGRGR